jgi:hypothetical protein
LGFGNFTFDYHFGIVSHVNNVLRQFKNPA